MNKYNFNKYKGYYKFLVKKNGGAIYNSNILKNIVFNQIGFKKTAYNKLYDKIIKF